MHPFHAAASTMARRSLPLVARGGSAVRFEKEHASHTAGRTMKTHSTTILTVRHKGVVAIGGDGQVTLGSTVMKADAVKIRRLMDNKVITGFAGSSADAFALLERFEAKLKDFPSNVPRAATELAKDWRTDRSCAGWKRFWS